MSPDEKDKNLKIIHKYDKIFKAFYEHATYDVFPILDEKRQVYDFILTKLNSFYFITNYISSKCGMKTRVQSEDAFFTIYNKAALDLFGIFHCLCNGLQIQAGIIYRSLYESYINCVFILEKDTDERIKLFYNFQFVERWNHIHNSLKCNPKYVEEMNIPNKKLNQYMEEYELLKNDYNKKYPYHWAYKIFKDDLNGKNPTLFTLCKSLGEDYAKEYNSVYGISSKQAHPSSVVGNHFIFKEQDFNVNVNSPIYNDGIVSTGVMSLYYCGHIILGIIKYFKVDNLDEISVYIKSFIDIAFDESREYLAKSKNDESK